MAWLHPQDLLSLARASRQLRTILMSRCFKGMWAAARRNVQGLPPPPHILSEPKYASVLFERDCQASHWFFATSAFEKQVFKNHFQACQFPLASKESPTLSIRLCSVCWKEK